MITMYFVGLLVVSALLGIFFSNNVADYDSRDMSNAVVAAVCWPFILTSIIGLSVGFLSNAAYRSLFKGEGFSDNINKLSVMLEGYNR